MENLSCAERAERGGVALVVALAITSVAIIAGVAVEAGRVRGEDRRLQDSTDAAVLHAAKLAVQGQADGVVGDGALEMVLADARGHKGSVPAVSTSVTSRSPVRVRVETTSSVPLPFGSVIGRTTVQVRGAAVAEARQDPLCILLLDPSASQTWSAGGSSKVVGRGCAAHVNSTSSTALQANGGAGAAMLAINVGGKVAAPHGFTPTPVSNQPSMADPIKPRVTWPSASTCTAARTNVTVNAIRPLTPGAYCGGITIGNGGIATLAPGIYVIQTGNLEIRSGGKLLAPVNTTIVLTGDGSTINILAGGAADIRAPASGPWRGIAIAQKPQSVERTSNMQGGGELLFDGIIYLPSQKLHLTGGGDMSVAGLRRVFIARKLETAGNGKVFVNGDPTLLAETARVRIVE